ncbi:MAG: hypothetical protein KDB00_03230, partial [Planctomycetales bacterium]|nr:hypothetical protein [Planctomycetales bacterium]
MQDASIVRLAGHHPAWLNALMQGLGHQIHVLKATESQSCVGVLPLAFVRGPIFGKFLVSLPYLNTGGVWARDDQVARQLIDAACDLADKLDVKHLELRHEQPVD